MPDSELAVQVLDALAKDPRVFAYSKWELRRNASVFKQLRGYMENAQSEVAQELKVLSAAPCRIQCINSMQFNAQ